MHHAQASSSTSHTSENCSSLDIKPTIQQNGASQQSSGPKQREGTTQATSISNNSGNTNSNNNSNSNNNNNNNNTNSNNNNNTNNSNTNSSLNAGLFDNSQSVYGGGGGSGNAAGSSSAASQGYDSSNYYHHQTNNSASATAFQSIGSGAANNVIGVNGQSIGNAGIGMRTNLSPHHHHHHHHTSSSTSSIGNKPQRTKPRTSAGKKTHKTQSKLGKKRRKIDTVWGFIHIFS